MRIVELKPLREQRDFSRYYPQGCPEGTVFREYGQARYPVGFQRFTGLLFPMRELATVEELEEYPWPDVEAPYRHQHLEDAVVLETDVPWANIVAFFNAVDEYGRY